MKYEAVLVEPVIVVAVERLTDMPANGFSIAVGPMARPPVVDCTNVVDIDAPRAIVPADGVAVADAV